MGAFSAVCCIQKCTLTAAYASTFRRMHACMQHLFTVVLKLTISLLRPSCFSYSLLYTHANRTHTHAPLTHAPHTPAHTPAHTCSRSLSSKGSVAYKLAAVSSQCLCVARGRQDTLLRLDGAELYQAYSWTETYWAVAYFFFYC